MCRAHQASERLRDQLRAVVHAQRRRRAVHGDQLVEHADHDAPLGIEIADSIASASRLPSSSTFSVRNVPAAVERVVHEVERPDPLSSGGASSGWRSRVGSRRFVRRGQIQPQRAVHAMHPLVVPAAGPIQPQPVEALPEAPARVLAPTTACSAAITAHPARTRTLRRPVVRRPREPHHPAGPRAPTARARVTRIVDRLPLRGRRHSFRCSTSLIAAFSSASSAYIRFSFAFSASSSFSRFSSETVAPPYFDFQLKYVFRLMPCLPQQISATGTPASPSFRIATICVSVNRDFRMPIPPSCGHPKVSLQLSTDRTCGHIVNVGKAKRDKVLVPRQAWLAKLKAIKAASDAAGHPLVSIARTDSVDGAIPGQPQGGVKMAIEDAWKRPSLAAT